MAQSGKSDIENVLFSSEHKFRSTHSYYSAILILLRVYPVIIVVMKGWRLCNNAWQVQVTIAFLQSDVGADMDSYRCQRYFVFK